MDARVTEFQCIMPMENIPSVMEHGILSYERSAKLKKSSSIALQEVQDRRDKKRVTRGMTLHQYANLYFHARNPMMFLRKHLAPDLCVLRVSLDVLKVPGVVLADRNASSDWVRFLDPTQSELLNFDLIYLADWRHSDRFEYYARKSTKCAEVLVPHCVEFSLVTGAWVVDSAAAERLAAMGFSLPIEINRVLFFR